MTPRADEYDHDNLSATDDDDDDDEGLKEDMAALSRACMIAADGGARTVFDVADPLLDAGDAIVPVNADADDDDDDDEQSDLQYLQRVRSLYQPSSASPPPTVAGSDDEEDDVETLRAILRRFSAYDQGPHEGSLETLAERDQASSLGCEDDIANGLTSCGSEAGELCPVPQDPKEAADLLTGNTEMQHCDSVESNKMDACKLSKLPQKRSSFPLSAQAFIDAIKKNRSLQRFLRSKLIEIESKIEENKQIRDKVKLLKDFQVSCSRRTGSALSLKKDPRVQLISAKKSHSKKINAMSYGPAENSHVANYKVVLERFPLSLDRKKWSKMERENLKKGIEQQFQAMVLQISVDRISSECSLGDANDLDSIIASVKDLEITPERIREFLPKVNWDQLASMYVTGRTGAECESRWLNCEDPLINHEPWTSEEDKSLLFVVQNMGIRNWFNIAVSLATNRTPFQCLARFQRSLNPLMLNREWTEEEDAQLCSAVAFFGESDWQSVASVLERRTGPQCSNRWKKSLYPVRKGSFTPEEDMRLSVAVTLFGRKWNQIAKFVPGRIQSQCRERYLNSLDPSLKWGGWTEEEDSRLQAAIAKHGYCWSKVAEDVPPRTDSQCRKRWKVLCPDQVPLLQEARKRQKSLLASNFVDRESERPALTLNDFLPLPMLGPPPDGGDVNLPSKRKRKSSDVPKKTRSKKHAKKARIPPEEVEDMVYSNEIKTCGGDVPFIASSNIPKKIRSKRNARKAQIHRKEVDGIVLSDEVKTCSGDDVHTVRITERHLEKDNCGNCASNRDRTVKQLCGGKLYAEDSSQASSRKSFVDGEVGSSSFARTVTKKESNNGGKLRRNAKGAERSKNRLKTKMSKPRSLSTCVGDFESQDGDDITLASFLHNKSKKSWLKCTENVNQASFSSRTRVVVSEQVENQTPSGEQDGLSQSCTGVTEDLFMEQNVASHGQVRKPEDVNRLSGDDDMTLACFLGNRSNKCSQATKGLRACSPSKLKKGSMLLPEVHCASKAAIIADDDGLAMSKLVEEQPVLRGGVAEPTNVNVEEENDLLASFLQNKTRRQRRQPKSHKDI